MASGAEDFYSVLGLRKESSVSEVKNSYKKLAMRWHPDRCSASGNLKFIEESKKKFQSIQEAYSVLSNENKRFMYDLGLYKNDDDDDDEENKSYSPPLGAAPKLRPRGCEGGFGGQFVGAVGQFLGIENFKFEFEMEGGDELGGEWEENGWVENSLADLFKEMGDFLGEMVDLMAQTKPNENAKAETFEDLQVLFQAMVQDNMQSFNSASQQPASNSRNNSATTSSKRNWVDLNSCSGWEKMDFRPAESHDQSFCLGAEGGLKDSRGRRGSSKRKTAGIQKSSSQHNMSSGDSKISV